MPQGGFPLRNKPVSVVLDFLVAVHFEPTLMADRDVPLWSKSSHSRVTMWMMMVRLRCPRRRRSPASPAPRGVSSAAGWSRTDHLPTHLEGFPARPRSLVEDLHLVIGEQAVGVVDPHVPDDPIELARACDGDSVGDVVG